MSIYRKVDVRVWSDEKFRRLSPLPPSGQSLWFFLLTGPFTGSVPGLFKAGPSSIAEELGWSTEEVKAAFAELAVEGMAVATWYAIPDGIGEGIPDGIGEGIPDGIGEGISDGIPDAFSRANLVWLPNALKYNPPTSINVIKAWKYELEKLPECSLLDRAMAAMEKEISLMGEGFINAFKSVMPKPMPKAKARAMPKPMPKPMPKAMPSPIQEQEQEQEQEKKNTRLPRPAAVERTEGRDLLRDALAEAFKSRVPEYANPAKENSNLLKLSAAIRRKAEAAEVAPEVAALGCVELFWKLHSSGKQFYSDFTPSKMLAILESLWGSWITEHEAFNVAWVEDFTEQGREPVGVSDDDF